MPLCPFHAVTGWWCPLCGGLRAAQALSHFNVMTAVHDNVLVVAAAPILLGFWLDWLVRTRSGRPPRVLFSRLGTVLVIVLIAFAVVRNLPWAAALRP